MKKLFFGLLGTVALTVTISAAPVACGSAGDSFLDYKTNVAYTAEGCFQDDKIYDNFMDDVAPSLAIPGDWTVVMSEDITDLHLINFSKGDNGTAAVGPNDYGVSYTVRVDPLLFPTKFITSVNVSIDANGAPGSSTRKLIYDFNGAQLADVTSFGGAVSQMLSTQSQFIRVVETLTIVDGAALQSFSDSYQQADFDSPVPEPATYGMMGLGLAALGLIARRKKA